MKIWYFHGQCKVNGLGTNKISYNIFDLRHVSKVATHFRRKTSIQKYPNKESGKIFKKRGCRTVFRTLPCKILK